MLQRVFERRRQYNNDTRYAQSALWTYGKVMYVFVISHAMAHPDNRYYRLFALAYGWCGSFAETVMVNSTWTKGHIDSIWRTTADIVYPPCDTERLNTLSLSPRKPKIVSVAQFR